MILEEQLAELERLSGHFEARKKRAAERLSSIDGNSWYFAIVGLESELDVLVLPPIAKIQRVIEPPGEVELASALKDRILFSTIGRYSHKIRYELVIDRVAVSDNQGAFNIAWWIISALRIKTLAEILVPAVADYSWSTISAISDGRCYVQMFEDVPKAKIFGPPVKVSQVETDWIILNLIKFSTLVEVPKFRLAVESLTENHFTNSERMVAATIWAGIEALFEIQIELSFRLAVVIASILESRGNSRKELYKRIKKLYGVRSKAVHGGSITGDKLKEHIIEARKLLSKLLCHFIEEGALPSEDEIDNYIFC
jgi:hypothetical protein